MYGSTIALMADLMPLGGIVRHMREMAEAWSREANVLLLEYRDRVFSITLWKKGGDPVRYGFFQDGSYSFLKELFSLWNVRLLHIHSTFRLTGSLHQFYKALDVPIVCTVHNYFAFCPLGNLYDGRGYCGAPERHADCPRCLSKAHREPYRYRRDERISVEAWRRIHGGILEKAAFAICPSDDMKRRMEIFFPRASWKVIENPEVVVPASLPETRTETSEARNGRRGLRVGILGRIGTIKGRDRIAEVVRLAERQRRPISFHVLGTLHPPVVPSPSNLYVAGPYKEAQIYRRIAERDIDFFWFPAIWPETYSYVLTIPVRLKIPVLGVDLGAIGDRIRKNHWGETYPWDASAEETLARILAFPYRKWRAKGDFSIRNDHFPQMADFYGAVWKPEGSIDGDAACAFLQELDGKEASTKNLTFFEMKTLLAKRKDRMGRLKIASRISLQSIWIDVRHAGLKHVLAHIKDGYL